jgi:hypothetical protein
MTNRYKLAAFRVEPEILAGLQTVKVRDGIPASEQVRRALRAWLDAKGVKVKGKRAAGHKRS